MNNKTILELLKEKFPTCWFKDGEEFDNNPNCLVWSGEGSILKDDDGNEVDAFDPYFTDAKEVLYIMGVHKDLHNFVKSKGAYWESYDAGTYLLYLI